MLSFSFSPVPDDDDGDWVKVNGEINLPNKNSFATHVLSLFLFV
jgi:hypothetical protein